MTSLLILREQARKLREEQETKREREREKVQSNYLHHILSSRRRLKALTLLQERIRAGKELMETKRIAEENERKRYEKESFESHISPLN